MKSGKTFRIMGTFHGSYTVEAAWVVSISLTIIMALILIGFSVYDNAMQYVCQKNDMAEVSSAAMFYQSELLNEMWNLLTGN